MAASVAPKVDMFNPGRDGAGGGTQHRARLDSRRPIGVVLRATAIPQPARLLIEESDCNPKGWSWVRSYERAGKPRVPMPRPLAHNTGFSPTQRSAGFLRGFILLVRSPTANLSRKDNYET